MARRSRKAPSGPRLGKQPPRYRFFLNPYRDARFTSCPQCGGKTRVRKLPFAIHVDRAATIFLNKTCKLCLHCDLLIAHQDEIEAHLAAYFGQHAPDAVGNKYLVIGTEDRETWRRGMRTPLSPEEALEHLHDFRDYVTFTPPPGWVRVPPPASTGQVGE
jgi:hypothetical protein